MFSNRSRKALLFIAALWKAKDCGTVQAMAENTQDSTPAPGQNGQPNNSPRDPSSQRSKYEPSKSQAGKLWDAFGNPEDQANSLPGAVSNSSSGDSNDPKDATVTGALKSLSTKDVTSFYKAPCARNALMLGIGAAFGIGGIRGVLGGTIYHNI